MTDDLAAGESALPFDGAFLSAVRAAFDTASPVIVELHFASSGDAPERRIFRRYDSLVQYLRMVARPGDMISAWRFDQVCRESNAIFPKEVLRGIHP